MEIKTIVTVIIAGMLGAVVFAGLLPVFEDSASTTSTFKNVGEFEVTYTQEEDVTFTWDHTSPREVTINEKTVELPTLTNGSQRTVLCGDTWIVRAGYGDSLGGYFIQWYPASGSNILASEGNGYDISITCSSGTVSVTDTQDTPSTATSTYTYLYCISATGDYVMKSPTDSVYMNGDSEFYAMGLTNVGTYTSTGIKITGNIDDGAVWSIFRGNPSTFTFSNENMNYTEVSNYKDLYKLDTLTATVTAGESSIDATYSYFIVPAEITAEKSIHADAPTTALLNLLPVLIAIGLIVGIAGAIFVKRM